MGYLPYVNAATKTSFIYFTFMLHPLLHGLQAVYNKTLDNNLDQRRERALDVDPVVSLDMTDVPIP